MIIDTFLHNLLLHKEREFLERVKNSSMVEYSLKCQVTAILDFSSATLFLYIKFKLLRHIILKATEKKCFHGGHIENVVTYAN